MKVVVDFDVCERRGERSRAEDATKVCPFAAIKVEG